MTTSRIPALALAVGFAALLGSVAQGSARLMDGPFPGFLAWDNGGLVAFHRDSWTGASHGLPLYGGRIVSVDGEPFVGGHQLLDTARSHPPGTPIRYRIRVGEIERDYDVPTMQLTTADFAATFGNYLFNAFGFGGIGLIALALRPDSRQARGLALATLSIGCLFALAIDYFTSYRFVRVCQIVEAATPFSVAWLALSFPSQRSSPTLRRSALGSLAMLGLVVGTIQFTAFYRDPDLSSTATLTVYVALAVITVAMLAGLAWAAALAERTDDRVRAGIVLAAALSGLLIPAIAILGFFGFGGGFSFTWVTFLLPVFPAAVLFAVVRHDLLQAEKVARLAVGYGTTTAGVAIGYSSALLGIERLFVGIEFRGTIVELLLLIGLAVSFNPLYRRVQASIDRVFYRSNLDAGRVLERISVLLATSATEAEVIAIVEREVGLALEADWVRIDLGDDEAPAAVLEQPIVHESTRLGWLRCGPKASGAPASGVERDLLVGAASQAALAIRNARSLDELRDAQEALVRSERLAAIGEVAGAVAHGVRNPLAGIRAAAQMAQEIEDPAERDEALRDLIDGADRLDTRVRRLLDFSRMLDPEIEPTELELVLGAVRSTLESRADQLGVALDVSLAQPGIVVAADPNQLEEALLKLVSNGLRATEPGGKVALACRAEADSAIIEIRDTGHGIAEAVQSRVFDLFFTTRADGTGMGLATVRKMLERQGASIDLIESTPAGTTFRMTLGRVI